MTTAKKRVDILLLSTGRAGSTSLYNYLNQACGLGAPANKEPHYWCDVKSYTGRGAILERIHIDNESAYFNLYKDSQLVFDASVGYFFCIEEVMDKLRVANQSPKVILLYREPVGRAISLFFEEAKKGDVSEKSLLADIGAADNKPDGLWWENYYDNVDYCRVFRLVADAGIPILCINQSYFRRNTDEVIHRAAKFLGFDALNAYDGDTLNSSAEAYIHARYPWLHKLMRAGIPGAKSILGLVTRRVGQESVGDIISANQEAVAGSLPKSIEQYRLFRNLIEEKDICELNWR